MTTGIYKIENLTNHKVYIGQSIHIEKRWKEHCQPSSDSLIGNAIHKYGKDKFSFQILEECEEHSLNLREEYYIHQYNSIAPNGYNIEDKSNGKRSYFLNYSKDTFDEIIKDIKFSDLTFKEISSKYGLDLSMIYYLNRGDYHTLADETYPLREIDIRFSSRGQEPKKYFCSECGVEISKGAAKCIKCSHKQQYKCEHPSRQQLKDLIRTESFVAIGKMYGVSDNAVRKWCKNYSLPQKRSEIKKITDQEWNKI